MNADDDIFFSALWNSLALLLVLLIICLQKYVKTDLTITKGVVPLCTLPIVDKLNKIN